MSEPIATCELCGEPMPPGEQMFKYHGYSGPCPKPFLPKPAEMKTTTIRLGDLKPGCRYLGRDGEQEYIVTDVTAPSDSFTVVNMASGESSYAHKDETRLAVTQNYRLRVID